MANETNKVMEFAKIYIDNGLSVIPLKPKSKEPTISWKTYQLERPNYDKIIVWFGGKKFKNRNIAIVTGSISENLVVIDFDKKEKYNEFMEKLPIHLKITLENTWTVKTGKGYHIYLRIENLTPEEFKEFMRTRVRFAEGIDIKAEGGYVVAPPSIHPSGAQYEFIRGPPEYGIIRVTPEDFEDIMKFIRPPETEKAEEGEKEPGWRALSKEDLESLFNLLKGVYKQGFRRRLFITLSAWFYDAKISKKSLKSLARMFKELDGDETVYKKIIEIIDYQYDRRIPELKAKGEKILKKKRETEGELLGLQDILENFYDESTATEILRQVEEILGKASPYRDSIIEVLQYEKQIYAVANLRKLTVYRARRTPIEGDNGVRYKLTPMERVFIGAPTRVVVYMNPLGGITHYEVTWEVSTRPRPYIIGPAPIEDILGRLRAEGLVVSRRLAEDVLNAIFEGFVRKGRAEIREEIEKPGFYQINDKIISVKYEIKEVSKEELREALNLLNTLAQSFSRVIDRFAIAIKWGIISPFIYIRKQNNQWVPWLYLYGPSDTGKTTIGRIIISLWNLKSSLHVKSGSSIDNVARLGNVLSFSTFPTLINEPMAALSREDVTETIKGAVESTIARSKYIRGTYTDIPALSPLIMASNKYIPKDDALLKRFIVLVFTIGEIIPKEKQRDFELHIEPQLYKLSAIGHVVAKVILEHPENLKKESWEELAEDLLTYCYLEAELEPPEWINLKYRREEDVYEDIREAIRSYMLSKINEAFARHVGRIEVTQDEDPLVSLQRTEISVKDRIRLVLEQRLLPWALLKPRPDTIHVVLTQGIVKDLEKAWGAINLKSLAELLGWEYKVEKIGGKPHRCVVVKFEEFVKFLSPTIEHETE